MRFLVFLLSLSVFCTGQENCDCNIEMYVSDSDPKGTNIRTEPSGEVLMKLRAVPDTVTDFHTVNVIAMKDGWFRINRVYPAYPAYKEKIVIDGWMHRSVLSTGVSDGDRYVNGVAVSSDTPIYSVPRYTAKAKQYRRFGAETTIIGCTKKWLKIKEVYKGVETIGWWSPEDQCPNPLTNCCNSNTGEMTGIDAEGNK